MRKAFQCHDVCLSYLRSHATVDHPPRVTVHVVNLDKVAETGGPLRRDLYDLTVFLHRICRQYPICHFLASYIFQRKHYIITSHVCNSINKVSSAAMVTAGLGEGNWMKHGHFGEVNCMMDQWMFWIITAQTASCGINHEKFRCTRTSSFNAVHTIKWIRVGKRTWYMW